MKVVGCLFSVRKFQSNFSTVCGLSEEFFTRSEFICFGGNLAFVVFYYFCWNYCEVLSSDFELIGCCIVNW